MANSSSYPQRIGEAHCRDYLRTGRCKYGESCKYHHPPNVASGGGIKTPLNPSEPPFPIRPNEPPCQYFLKHGTCKFGQQCKFDHPESSNNTSNNNNSKNNNNNNNTNNAESSQGSGSPSSLVILPQRPSAPDCLYFLRHGRCKYGATCKYHHPLHGSSSPFSNVGRHPSISMPHQSRIRNRSSSMGSHNDIMDSQNHCLSSDNHRPLSYPGSAPMHILVEGPVIMLPQPQQRLEETTTLTYYSSETNQRAHFRPLPSSPPHPTPPTTHITTPMPPSLQLPPLCRAASTVATNATPNPSSSAAYYPTTYTYDPRSPPSSPPSPLLVSRQRWDSSSQRRSSMGVVGTGSAALPTTQRGMTASMMSMGPTSTDISSPPTTTEQQIIHPWDDGLSKMTSALLHMLDTPSCDEEEEDEGGDVDGVTTTTTVGAAAVMGRRKGGFYG